MAKTKKEKKVIEPEVEVKPEVVESAKEEVVETPDANELKRIYAADKARNPELYELKNKDEQLKKKLSQLK